MQIFLGFFNKKINYQGKSPLDGFFDGPVSKALCVPW